MSTLAEEQLIDRLSRASLRLVSIEKYIEVDSLNQQPRKEIAANDFLLITSQGRAFVNVAGIVYEATSSHIVYGSSGMPLTFEMAEENHAYYLIYYEANEYHPVQLLNMQQHGILAIVLLLPLQQLCEKMEKKWWSSTALEQLHVQSLFLSFIYEAVRQSETARRSVSKENMVTEIIHYIDDHYTKLMTTEDLASLYGCSTSYLSRIFKHQIGIGPIEYLIHVRIRQAKQLLLKTNVRIQEVANSVGYADVYYFSRLFKKHTGYSPLQYRQNNQSMVQYNPLELLKMSIASSTNVSHNENEIYYQLKEEGETTVFRFSRPNLGVMMLLCTAIILSACQSGGSAEKTNQTSQPQQTSNTVVEETANNEPETRSYEHLRGTTDIPTKPERVVSFFHLGELMTLGVKPLGTNTFMLQNPLMTDVDGIVDIGVPPNAETVLSLDPDLIITTVPYMEIFDGGYEALSKIAPTVVVEQYNDPYKDVEMFGDILGKQEEAKQWKEKFTAKIEDAKAKVNASVAEDETFSIINVRQGAFFVYGDTNMGGNIIYKYLGLQAPKKVETDVINGETWEISGEAIPEFIGDRLFLAVNADAKDEVGKIQTLIDSSPAGKAGKVYTIEFEKFLQSDPISVEQQMDIMVDLIVGNE